jgi:hypothetical protein
MAAILGAGRGGLLASSALSFSRAFFSRVCWGRKHASLLALPVAPTGPIQALPAYSATPSLLDADDDETAEESS